MDIDRLCVGCFREISAAVCPYCGYDPNAEAAPGIALPSKSILNGRYLTGRVLGQGGFGITYLGFDLVLQIKVAIKEYMPAGLASRTADGLTVTLLSQRDDSQYGTGKDRFLEEARILAQLSTVPNIVSVSNYFMENNTAYFVMEYVEGRSLKETLRRQGGTIPFEQARALLLPVMEALISVHERSLLHRDISPDNIYITTSGQSKLLDFGAARFALGDEKSLSVILKHGYAPEEQYRPRGNQGAWTDVYAMGATLYHCVTGTPPPDALDRLHADTLRLPGALGIPVPKGADAVFAKALALRAEERYRDMRELIAALLALDSAPIGATDTARAVYADAGKGSTVAVPYAPPVAEGARGKGAFLALLKRYRVWAALIGSGALVLIVVTLVLALRPNDTGTGGLPRGTQVVLGGSASPEAPPTSAPTPVPTVPNTPPPATPTETAPTPTATVTAGGETIPALYRCPELGFTLRIHSDWSVHSSSIGEGIVYLVKDGYQRGFVQRGEDWDRKRAQQNRDAFLAEIAKGKQATDYSLISESTIPLGARYESYYLTAMFTLAEDRTELIHFYFLDGTGKEYFLLCFAETLGLDGPVDNTDLLQVVDMFVTFTLWADAGIPPPALATETVAFRYAPIGVTVQAPLDCKYSEVDEEPAVYFYPASTQAGEFASITKITDMTAEAYLKQVDEYMRENYAAQGIHLLDARELQTEASMNYSLVYAYVDDGVAMRHERRVGVYDDSGLIVYSGYARQEGADTIGALLDLFQETADVVRTP